jgi:hypothetical protein
MGKRPKGKSKEKKVTPAKVSWAILRAISSERADRKRGGVRSERTQSRNAKVDALVRQYGRQREARGRHR